VSAQWGLRLRRREGWQGRCCDIRSMFCYMLGKERGAGSHLPLVMMARMGKDCRKDVERDPEGHPRNVLLTFLHAAVSLPAF